MDKDTPSNSELFRVLSDLKQMRKEDSDIASKRHEENIGHLNKLDINFVAQNGRVTTLEKALNVLGDKFAEYVKSNDSNVSVFKRWVWVLMGAGIVVSTFGVMFINYWFDHKFGENFTTAINTALENYDEIKIDNQ